MTRLWSFSQGLGPISPEFTSTEFHENQRKQAIIGRGSIYKEACCRLTLKCCGFVFIWLCNINVCVWDTYRHETKAANCKHNLTHIQTYSLWTSANPHVLNVSTNCLMCSCLPHKPCQAGLEIGCPALDGAMRASIESVLWAHMGWWRWQLGEDLAACQAERGEACPRVAESRLRTAQRHGELSGIFGEENYWMDSWSGEGVRGKEESAWQSWVCFIFFVQMLLAAEQSGRVCSATLVRDGVLIGLQEEMMTAKLGAVSNSIWESQAPRETTAEVPFFCLAPWGLGCCWSHSSDWYWALLPE